MSSSLITVQSQRATAVGRVADYAELTKPRILVMVLITVAVAGIVGTWGQPDLALLHTLLGTSLVAASASVLNQLLERHTDAMMPRTSDRPLPAGRMSGTEVLGFGMGTGVLGLGYLMLTVNLPTVLAATATWLLYVCVYTPLKSRTSLNTVIGAVPGALPVMIGWLGAQGTLDLRAWTLFLLLYLWQFPHFMAIAWLYRRQYADAGLQMLTVVDPSGRRAGIQAVLAALSLIPVSLLPALLAVTGSLVFVGVSFVLGVGQLVCALLFWVHRDDVSARRLLRASLIYLPLQLALLTMLNLALI